MCHVHAVRIVRVTVCCIPVGMVCFRDPSQFEAIVAIHPSLKLDVAFGKPFWHVKKARLREDFRKNCVAFSLDAELSFDALISLKFIKCLPLLANELIHRAHSA